MPALLAPLHGRAAPLYTVTALPTGFNSYDINNLGQISGYTQSEPGAATYAALYTGGGITQLGGFGDGVNAQSLNARGDVVGSASTWDGPAVGYISFGGQLIDLNTLIDPASGWKINGATGINDLGQIVASACRDVECTSVRLDLVSAVPEPGMALMLLPGVLAVMGVRRRRMRKHEG